MSTYLKNLFVIKGYSLFLISLLLVGIGGSISFPYISLYLTKEIGIAAGAFGIFMAISQLSGVFVNSFIAKRSDNGMSRKWIILFAMLSASLGYGSYLIFNNFFVLLIFFSFFSGLGAPVIPQIFAYAQESINESKSENKNFALFSLRSFVSLGVLLGPMLGALILSFNSYKSLFMMTSIIYVFNALLILLFLQNRKMGEKIKQTSQVANHSLIKNRQIRLPFIAFIILFTVSAVNFINTPLFIANELGGSSKEIGFVFGISAALEIPIMLMLGALGKKISNRTLIILGSVISIMYFSVLSLSTDSWHIMAAQILQASFVAILMGNGLSYFIELLPDFPGVSTTMHTNADLLGRIAGSVGAGMIAQFAGFRLVNMICIVIVCFSLFILWRTKPVEKMDTNIEQAQSV